MSETTRYLYVIIVNPEVRERVTDELKAKVAEAVKIPLTQLMFKVVDEADRPGTNAEMWEWLKRIGAAGVTDLTLPIYATATRQGLFFQLDIETGEVKQVKKLTVEFDEQPEPASNEASKTGEVKPTD